MSVVPSKSSRRPLKRGLASATNTSEATREVFTTMLLDANTISRNETIPQLLDTMKGMIYNFSRKFNLEFDDCFQTAALIALEVWPRIPDDCANIGAYLNRCIRG